MLSKQTFIGIVIAFAAGLVFAYLLPQQQIVPSSLKISTSSTTPTTSSPRVVEADRSDFRVADLDLHVGESVEIVFPASAGRPLSALVTLDKVTWWSKEVGTAFLSVEWDRLIQSIQLQDKGDKQIISNANSDRDHSISVQLTKALKQDSVSIQIVGPEPEEVGP